MANPQKAGRTPVEAAALPESPSISLKEPIMTAPITSTADSSTAGRLHSIGFAAWTDINRKKALEEGVNLVSSALEVVEALGLLRGQALGAESLDIAFCLLRSAEFLAFRLNGDATEEVVDTFAPSVLGTYVFDDASPADMLSDLCHLLGEAAAMIELVHPARTPHAAPAYAALRVLRAAEAVYAAVVKLDGSAAA